MDMGNTEQILVKNLGKELVSNYHVMDFCKEAGISRPTFYARYNSMTGLFCEVLSLQVSRAMRVSWGEKINKVVFNMLHKMKKNNLFYINIFNLTKDKNLLSGSVRNAFANSLEKYLRPRGAFSVRTLKLVSSNLYSIILFWVCDRFKDSEIDIYQCICMFLPLIETYISKNKKLV